MFDNMGDIEEVFNKHLQDIQNPNIPINRNFNVVGTSEVCMSLKRMVNDSNENLIVESNDKPSQSGNTQYSIGSRNLRRNFFSIHREEIDEGTVGPELEILTVAS